MDLESLVSVFVSNLSMHQAGLLENIFYPKAISADVKAAVQL